jgi:hypothetical protein
MLPLNAVFFQNESSKVMHTAIYSLHTAVSLLHRSKYQSFVNHRSIKVAAKMSHLKKLQETECLLCISTAIIIQPAILVEYSLNN